MTDEVTGHAWGSFGVNGGVTPQRTLRQSDSVTDEPFSGTRHAEGRTSCPPSTDLGADHPLPPPSTTVGTAPDILDDPVDAISELIGMHERGSPSSMRSVPYAMSWDAVGGVLGDDGGHFRDAGGATASCGSVAVPGDVLDAHPPTPLEVADSFVRSVKTKAARVSNPASPIVAFHIMSGRNGLWSF